MPVAQLFEIIFPYSVNLISEYSLKNNIYAFKNMCIRMKDKVNNVAEKRKCGKGHNFLTIQVTHS